ncbi:15646_t:CDS:2, partial [Funneliformis geosporum]
VTYIIDVGKGSKEWGFQHKGRYIAISIARKSRPLRTLTAFTSSTIEAL